ncbi:hypothetical protein ES288_D12G105700v1 [Gossypium darwinii]|uniref:Retrotransposon Copia-like N-terminal domain-containing protein n=2 Tax=Gossypium TaxID=3633 RepID=A0A5D2I8B5_GOSTO|nr:hypothetical protein ES288_D12G105700v1 [Gossypium darwinii]TYH38390.1 hypothetical protein ES332_D12G106900v1 [Gossypium tomentosum]
MSTNKKLVIPTDNPSLQISPVKLDGHNYLTWSRSCLLFIKDQPELTDSTFSQWDSTNPLVMASFINSMQTHISKTYLLLDTVKKIWNVAALTYSRVGNDAQIF